MGQLTFCLLVALVFLPRVVVSQVWAFNCLRRDTACFSGRCIPSGNTAGSCDCGAGSGRSGFNCGLQNSEIVAPSVCGRLCRNGGTCYRTPGAADRCYCPASHFGDTCDNLRVRVIGCTETTMTVTVNPNVGNFVGKIYVKGYSASQACRLPASTDNLNPGYLRTLSTEDVTSNLCRDGLSRTADGIAVYKIIVQHDLDMMSGYDEEHTARCDGTVASVSSVDLGSIAPDGTDGTSGLGGTTSTGTLRGDMRLVLTDVDRNPVQQPYYLGQDLKLEASALPTSPSQIFRMTKCTAIGGGKSLVLVENSCITANGTYSGVTRLEKIGNVVAMSFFVFRFEATASLTLSCEFNMCNSATDANCAAVNCRDGTVGMGRRRREAEEPRTSNVTQKMYVLLNKQELYDALDQRDQAVTKKYETCFHDAFIIVAALVGILLFVVVILLLLICLRMRSRKATKEVVEFTNDGANRM